MVSVVQEENSSSQSAKRIVSIRKAKGVVPAFLVEASDGSSFFCPQHLFRTSEFSLHLFKGGEVNHEQWARFQELSEQMFGYLQVIRLLTRREHTRQELEQKLLVRGYTRSSIAWALDRAESEGYISHDRFAGLWLEQRIRSHPESLNRLQARLQEKGLSRSHALEAVQTYCVDHEISDVLLCERAYLKIPKSYGVDKVVKKLQSLGFPYSVVKNLLTKYNDGKDE